MGLVPAPALPSLPPSRLGTGAPFGYAAPVYSHSLGLVKAAAQTAG